MDQDKELLEEMKPFIFDLRNRFDVQIGFWVWERGIEIYAHDGKKRVFGTDISVRLRENRVDINSTDVHLELNFGSLGAFNPSTDNPMTFNSIFRGRLVEKWGDIQPLFMKAINRKRD